jgi:hypothetical protein
VSCQFAHPLAFVVGTGPVSTFTRAVVAFVHFDLISDTEVFSVMDARTLLLGDTVPVVVQEEPLSTEAPGGALIARGVQLTAREGASVST